MPNLLNVKQLAERLGVAQSTIWNYAKNGVLPKPLKLGQLSRWDASEVEAHIKSRQAKLREAV